MKKSLVTLGTAAVVLLTSTFATEPVFAERSLQDVQNERKEIRVELSKAEKKVAEVLKEIKELDKEINQLESAIKANEKQLKKTEKTIKKLEKEINQLQEEIDEIQEQIDIRDGIIKERISSYQANGGNVHILEFLTGAKNFVDLISRIDATVTITKADQEIIKKQEEEKQIVEDKQAQVEEKLATQEEKKAEIKEIIKTTKGQKDKVEKKKKEIKKKENQLRDELNKLQLKDNDLARIEASLLAPSTSSNSSNSSSSSGSSNSSGGNVKTVAYTGTGGSAIQAGYKVLGTPYVWAGKGPGGFDCSGFVSWAYRQEGISLPSSTAGLSSVGTKISYSQAKPGDLVFFNTYKTNGHVGIYLGNGKFIGAQNSTGVAVADMNSGYWKKHFSGHVRRVK